MIKRSVKIEINGINGVSEFSISDSDEKKVVIKMGDNSMVVDRSYVSQLIDELKMFVSENIEYW